MTVLALLKLENAADTDVVVVVQITTRNTHVYS
jgi:hypothetical protein